ncbi:hypothetical protein HK405_013766, partial [Cladochytrium tenue]
MMGAPGGAASPTSLKAAAAINVPIPAPTMVAPQQKNSSSIGAAAMADATSPEIRDILAAEARRRVAAERARTEQARATTELESARRAKQDMVAAQEMQHARPLELHVGPAMFQKAPAKKTAKPSAQQMKQAAMRPAAPNGPSKPMTKRPPPSARRMAPAAVALRTARAHRHAAAAASKSGMEAFFIPTLFADPRGFATRPSVPPRRLLGPVASYSARAHAAVRAAHNRRTATHRFAAAAADRMWAEPDGVARALAAMFVPCPQWEAACRPVSGVHRALPPKMSMAAAKSPAGGASPAVSPNAGSPRKK